LRRLLHIAILFALASLSACNKNKPPNSTATALLAEGKQAFGDNKMLDAYAKLQQSRDAFAEAGDSSGHFEATVYLCLLHQLIGQGEESYKLLNTLNFIDIPNNRTYCSLYYLRLKSYFAITRDMDYGRAKFYAQKSIDFVKEKHPEDTALLYMDMANLSELHFLAGEYGQAERLATELWQARQPEFKLYLSELYYCLGLLSLHRHDYDSARIHLDRGLAESRRYDAFDNEKNILSVLCRIDSTEGDLKAYIKHRREYDQLREKLEGNQLHYKMAIAQGQHEMDLMRAESHRRRAVGILSLCLLAVALMAAIIIFALIYKSLKGKQRNAMLEKQKLADAVAMEKMEKELLQLKMEKKGQLLNMAYKDNIEMTLKLAEQTPDADDTKAAIARQLRSTEDLLHRKIGKKHPSLTHNDIRIMALLKLHTNPTDMASALNITEESLVKAKYRLRRKLNLGSAEALSAFIETIE